MGSTPFRNQGSCCLYVLPCSPEWLLELQVSSLHSGHQEGRRVEGPTISLISKLSGALQSFALYLMAEQLIPDGDEAHCCTVETQGLF